MGINVEVLNLSLGDSSTSESTSLNKEPSIYDVHKKFWIFDPLPCPHELGPLPLVRPQVFDMNTHNSLETASTMAFQT